MSALGQKQTCAAQNGMSALPLITTVKADIAYRAQAPLVSNRGVRPCKKAAMLKVTARPLQSRHCGSTSVGKLFMPLGTAMPMPLAGAA